MADLFSLKGKTVLITGGATHLGKALSEGVCQYGGQVIIGSRDLKRNKEAAYELSQRYAVSCTGVYLDFTNAESIQTALCELPANMRAIDVLINNAVYYAPGAIHQQSQEEFMEGLMGTIGGTFQVTRAVLPKMMEQRHGNIINIASMYGMVSPNPDVYQASNAEPTPGNYGCGKAAVIQFTKYLSCSYAYYGIRANAIVPGPFPNPKVQKNSEFIHQLANKAPLRRIGVPDDLKGIAVLLASDASSYITGQAIAVDGGWTAW